MDKFEELRAGCAELAAQVPENAREALSRYVLSAVLRIWGSNRLYSGDYTEAVRCITGKTWSYEQILTAMRCCGDPERELAAPAFFRDMITAGRETVTAFLESLNELLAAAAFINGDFTMEEANTLSSVLNVLVRCCAQNGLEGIAAGRDLSGRITALKEDSYLLRPAKPEQPAAETPPEASSGTAGTPGSTEENSLEKLLSMALKDEITLTLDLTGDDDGEDGALTFELREEKPEKSKAPEQPGEEQTLERLLAELDGLVGLDTVKQDVHSLLNFIKVTKLREARGMKVPTVSYHLVFTGNPGTGKTTVARLVAGLYYRMGLLPKGQLVEADRSTLVAGYLGQTAIKTQKVIQEALGGVLFIDEAYALANDDQDSYGREAIETLLKAMEDHRDELVVIVAGYDDLMHQFIDSNPGLASRFNKYFYFPDYTGEEMLRIFRRFCSANGYVPSERADARLLDRFLDLYAKREPHFGNARTVRNLFEKAIAFQADRLAALPSVSDKELEILTEDDTRKAWEKI